MKRCPNCKRIYNDNDIYCLNDNYRLVKMDKENSANSKKSNKTIRCPRCRKMISQKDMKCVYCGFDSVSSYISSTKRKEKETQKKQGEKMDMIIYDSMTHKRKNSVLAGNNSNVSWKEIFILCVIVIAAFWLLGSWARTGNNPKEEKCQVCYKTFTNKDDVHSIIMTNMCENCYSNFKYTQDLKDELKKYEERYGD